MEAGVRLVCALGGYTLLTTALYEIFKVFAVVLVFMFMFEDINVYCSFYSVCNTDASDVS